MVVEAMVMEPERSKPPLHNFTLPCGLKWGNQKFLRCVKVDSDGGIAAVHRRSYGSPARRRGSDEMSAGGKRAEVVESGRKFGSDVDNGIAAVRKKLMFDLQKAADKMKDAIFREGLEEEEERRRRVNVEEEAGRFPAPSPSPATKTVIPVPPSVTVAAIAESARPWNLRTRRSAFKTPNGFVADAGGSSRGLNIEVMKPNVSPSRTENKSPRLHSSPAAASTATATATAIASTTGEKRDRAKFSVPLSRREIEEDFMAMAGQRPSRRPKKRPKLVQKNLDTLFPGLWLSEITPDLYKVPDDQLK